MAAKVADRLEASDTEVHAGLVGLVSNGKGPVVLLRADMDALPVAEAMGRPLPAGPPPRRGRKGGGGDARLRP